MKDCKITDEIKKWIIPNLIINEILRYLYYDVEMAGELKLTTETKEVHKYTTIQGESSTVSTPKAILNYHTHPISCYVSEKTIWGWPSGEDIRECIFSALEGTIAHLTVAVEGSYVIQVNPCILENFISLDSNKLIISYKETKEYKKFMSMFSKNVQLEDILRGLIILLIEIYFKSTHAFRTKEYNDKHTVTPNDFITFSNLFTLKNIFNKKTVKECGSLRCHSLWTFEDNKYEKMSFKDYVSDYEDDTTIYLCKKNGNRDYTEVLIKKIFRFPELLKVLEGIDFSHHCKFPEHLWNNHWLYINFSEHEVISDGKSIGNYISQKDHWALLQKGKELILKQISTSFFYFFDMTEHCNHDSIAEHLKSLENKQKSKTSSKTKTRTRSLKRRTAVKKSRKLKRLS